MIPVLELGGTHVAAAWVEPDTARVVGIRRRPIRADAPAATLLADIAECAGGLGAAGREIWGAAVPGPFDYRSGVARYHDVGKFDSLAGVDIGAEFLDRISPRPGGVVFLNDAAAFVLGEWRGGAARGHDRVIGLTLGTGVGSGFLAGGRIVRSGQTVPPEGRIDLTTIDGNPLEEVVSRRAMLRDFPGVDVCDLAAAARTGNGAAAALFDRTFRLLGAAIAPWVDRFAADMVVVGGSMTGSWELIGPPLRAGLGCDVRLARARLPEAAGFVGAAWHVGRAEPAE